jgi:hypothetical protein
MNTTDKNKPKGSGSQNAEQTEHGYVKACGMAVDYETCLPRATSEGEREPETRKPVCPNCGQWQDNIKSQPSTYLDCFNDCAERGFAPKGERESESRDWGAFDSEGKLRATFDSESEAHFYVRNRGHMHNGSYRAIKQERDELLAACKWLYSLFDNESGEYQEQYQDQTSVACEKAEAAIAKAEGSKRDWAMTREELAQWRKERDKEQAAKMQWANNARKIAEQRDELLADAKAAATAYETLSDEALDGAMTKLQATIAAIARAKKGAGQ